LTVGTTTVCQTGFEAWCREQQHTVFDGSKYNLFENNCNHFSDKALLEGLKVSRGVPQWILDVPQRFLASPFGQLARPMLENMQVAGGVPMFPTTTAQVESTVTGTTKPLHPRQATPSPTPTTDTNTSSFDDNESVISSTSSNNQPPKSKSRKTDHHSSSNDNHRGDQEAVQHITDTALKTLQTLQSVANQHNGALVADDIRDILFKSHHSARPTNP
jgi:hypothetical protein